MEWTKTKQINEEDFFVGRRVWAFNLSLSYRYRKTLALLCPAEVFISDLRGGYGSEIVLTSPFTSITAFGARDWYAMPFWAINNTAGLFDTEEDAVFCWNEAIDSCIEELKEKTEYMKYQYLFGIKEYQLTAGKDPNKKYWEATPEADVFKNSKGKYYVSYSSPFRHSVGLLVPSSIRFTSRDMGGGRYPIWLGRGQVVYEYSPKTMATMFFPSKSDVALYYSNIGKYEVCKMIDEWTETSLSNLESFKIK
jgi:hypothetical protein